MKDNVNQESILVKIRAEIKKAVWEDVVASYNGSDEIRIPRLDPDDVFEIIDKYMVESEDKEKMKDNVNHPSHYADGRKYEPIKVINDWDLDFNLGNTVKYISRAGRKGDKLEDLEKALFYLKEAINNEKELRKETKPKFKVGDKIKYLTKGGWHNYGEIISINEDSYLIQVTSKGFYKIELPDYVRVLFDDDDAHIEKVED